MEQTPSHAEVLAKRLEETWGRVQPSARLPDDVSSRITPQEKVLWEPDPKPLMANHPPRVTDSNTRIGFSIITSEGLTTLVHPQLEWTITSGMWNTLRTTWGPTMVTLMRIHESCKTQSLLESTDVLTPTRHILQAIRRIWMVDRVHGLPAVTDPSFFPLSSRNEDIWWGSQDMKTVYLDKRRTPLLRQAGYQQLLDIHKNKQSDC
jgi:hypothetical protein